MKSIFAGSLILLALSQGLAVSQTSPIRLGAWYWLNSAPKSEWEKDFCAARDIGFTDISLAWGLAVDAFALREEDGKFALQACRRAGLGAYLCIWNPVGHVRVAHRGFPCNQRAVAVGPPGARPGLPSHSPLYR